MRFRSDLRKDSRIAPGEKLMVLRRRDGYDTPLVKLSAMDNLMWVVGNIKTSSQI